MDSETSVGMLAQDLGTISVSGETLLGYVSWFSLRATLHISMLICALFGTRSLCTSAQWRFHMDADLLMAFSECCFYATFRRSRTSRRTQIEIMMHLPMHPLQATNWMLVRLTYRQCQSIRLIRRQCHAQTTFTRPFPQTSRLVLGEAATDITTRAVPATPSRSIRRLLRTRQSGLLHASSAILSSTRGEAEATPHC